MEEKGFVLSHLEKHDFFRKVCFLQRQDIKEAISLMEYNCNPGIHACIHPVKFLKEW